jgi:hypothetical protein
VQDARYLTTAVGVLQSESRAQDQDVALAGSERREAALQVRDEPAQTAIGQQGVLMAPARPVSGGRAVPIARSPGRPDGHGRARGRRNRRQ